MSDDASPENLRKFLESDDPAMRRMGLSMAKGMKVPDSYKLVMALSLWDPEEENREAAKELVEEIGIENIIDKEKDTSATDEEILVRELSRENAVIPLIMAVNTEEGGFLKSRIISALGKTGDERAVEPLIEMLEDFGDGEDYDSGVEEIIEALGDIGGEKAILAIADGLTDRYDGWYYSYDSTACAAAALTKIGEPSVGAILGFMCDNLAIGEVHSLEIKSDMANLIISILGENKAADLLSKEFELPVYEHSNSCKRDDWCECGTCLQLEECFCIIFALHGLGDKRSLEKAIILREYIDKDSQKELYSESDEAGDDYLYFGRHFHSYQKILEKIGLDDGFSNTRNNTDESSDMFEEKIAKQDWEALVEQGEPAVESLIKALENDDWTVHKSIIEALGEIGDTRSVDPLIRALEEKHFSLSAVEALGEIGDVRAVEPLIKVIEDKLSQIHQNAVEALGKIGDARAVEPLIKVLGYDDKNTRMAAAGVLGEIGDARAVQPLIKALGAGNSAAAMALGKIGDVRALEPLIKASEDKDESFCMAVANALDMLKWEPDTDKLLAAHLIAKQDWEALVEWGEPAVGLLGNALDNNDWRVMRRNNNIVEVLGKIGAASSIDSLIKMLEDFSAIQESAKALERIGEPAVEPLIKELGNRNSDVRKYAVRALGVIGDARAVEPLIEALSDKGAYVSREAAEALGEIGDASAVEPLNKLLEAEHSEFGPFTRRLIVEALRKLGHEVE